MTSTNHHKSHKNKASTISTSQPTDPNENNHPNKNEDEDEDTNKNENEKNKPAEDDEETGGGRQLTDEEELKQAQQTYENSVSTCCKLYDTPEIFKPRDKAGCLMIAYPCKMCGGKISCLTHDTSCGNLNKHAATCLSKQSKASTTKSLLSLGVTVTGLIEPKEVPQLCVKEQSYISTLRLIAHAHEYAT
ncbi:hypothetical protein PSHT_01348 [Puccinia striiformis]|uniref:Uncharacterized protein n=2 Tax=Puccinia striiformis TaxID=27350 RepID=A0A0L0V9L2_9BASI|nr:hypothetical protein PSTG_10813 [Puccinia striiformis f. sp. tritici PST-78]POW22438.1 hypothetical protein PSHT_01348 [Puccinia striiformis]